MTLEEAIHHAEEKAKCGGKCGEDHVQLAEWLKELKERRAAELEKRTGERTETHACDCISRAAAIDALQKEINKGIPPFDDVMGSIRCGVRLARNIIEDLPSAERKPGRWVPVMNGRGGHCCNRCNGYAPSYMNGDEHLSDFCPYCGADMRGGQDE